jgi:hypothetical protein
LFGPCRANQLFDLARSAAPPGGFSNSSIDYNTTAESWREQRAFITDAPKLLVSEQPALAAALTSALEGLRDVRPPSTQHLSVVADPTTTRFQCGGGGQLQVGFDARGAMSTLISSDDDDDDDDDEISNEGGGGGRGGGGGGGEGGIVWANASHPLGLFEYQVTLSLPPSQGMTSLHRFHSISFATLYITSTRKSNSL